MPSGRTSTTRPTMSDGLVVTPPILAFDPGWRNMGFAIRDGHGLVTEHGVIVVPPKTPFAATAEMLSNRILALIEEVRGGVHGPVSGRVTVAYEAFTPPPGSRAAYMLAGACSVIEGVARASRCFLMVIPTLEARRAVGAHEVGAKPTRRQVALPGLRRVKLSQHSIDALAVSEAARERYLNP